MRARPCHERKRHDAGFSAGWLRCGGAAALAFELRDRALQFSSFSRVRRDGALHFEFFARHQIQPRQSGLQHRLEVVLQFLAPFAQARRYSSLRRRARVSIGKDRSWRFQSVRFEDASRASRLVVADAIGCPLVASGNPEATDAAPKHAAGASGKARYAGANPAGDSVMKVVMRSSASSSTTCAKRYPTPGSPASPSARSGLRPPEGPHRALSRRRVRGRLPAQIKLEVAVTDEQAEPWSRPS